MLLKVYKSRVWILLFMLVPFLGSAQIPGLPPGWDFTLNPTSATYAIPSDVVFNNVDTPQPGDWIGVFYDDDGVMECGGAVQWDGTANVAIVAFGNDTLVAPDKNGFSDGELVQWKIYYEATSTEAEVCTDPTFYWMNGDLDEVMAFNTCGCVQTIEYVTGWNWISFNALPATPTAANVLADFNAQPNDVIKTQSGSAFYTGSSWFPPTFTIDPDNAYLLKASGPDGSFDVEGECIDVEDPIDITGGGWTWIGYKPEPAMTPADAFVSIAPFMPNDIVKTQSGSAFFNGAMWFPPTFTLERGIGYKLKYQGADNTLVYPTGTDATSASGPTTSKVLKGDPGWTPAPGMETNMNVFVDDASVEGVPVLNGKVGTFDMATDECRGVADFFAGDAFLTVGFNSDEEGNEFYYLVWDSDADIIYEVEETDVYESDAFINRNLTLIPPITVNNISGTVTDEVTGDPLEGVEITATPGSEAIDGDPGWTPAPGMETNMNVFVDDASVGGVPVLNGKVGTFDMASDECRGVADFFAGDAFLTVGFNSDEEGNEFYYLVWDSDADIIYEVEETGVYESDAFINQNLTLIPGITPLVTFTGADGTYLFEDVPDETWTVCTGVTTPTDGYIDECAEPVVTPPSQVVDFALEPEVTCEDAVINNFPEFQEDVCQGTALVIDFSGVEILNAETVEWLVDPVEAGEYVGTDFVLNTDYSGPVTLTLNAYAFDPCEDATASLSFTVFELPEVSITAYEPVCAGSEMFELYGGLPEGGTYFVDGVEATTFDPVEAGTFVIEYCYTDENGCSACAETELIVNPLPEVTIEAYEPVCVASGMFELYGGLPEGGTYYVDGEEATMFDPVEAGTFVIEYCYTDENGCSACAETELIVNPLPEVFCPEDMVVCVNDDPFMLTGATPEGGVYDGVGVVDGMFDPALAGVGTFEIIYTYTDENGCTNGCDFLIEVLPATTVFAGDDATIGEDDTYTLEDATAENVDFVEWSTSGDGTFDNFENLNATYFPGPDDIAAGLVTLTLYGEGPCGSDEDAMELTISATPCIDPPTAFAGDDAAVCEDEDYMLMDATATNYSALMWETSGDGMFDDPTALNPTYTLGVDDIANGSVELCLTAEPSDPNCNPATDCMILTVNMLPDVTIEAYEPVCEGSGEFDLYGGLPEGGTYYVDGEEATMFDPVEPGTYVIEYCYTDENGCMACATTELVVNPLPDVTIEVYEPVCEGSGEFELYGGLPENGTYYVDGEEATMFDPVEPGTYIIEYCYTDENGCMACATTELVVNPLPDVTIEAYEPVCQYSGEFDLYGGLPEGGTYYVDGVEATVFDPMFAGTYVIEYCYENEFGCEACASTELVVNPTPEVMCPEDMAVCANEEPFELTGATPEGGEYTGEGVVDGMFDPALSGPGMFEITYTYENEFGCSNFCMFMIEVYALPYLDVSLSADEICLGDAVTGTIEGPEDGAYPYTVDYELNGVPMTDVVETSFLELELVPEEAGLYTLEVLMITDANGCVVVPNDYLELNVLPLTAITMQPEDVEILYGGTAEFMVEAENATGYQWYGPDGMIAGANSATLTIEGVTLEDEGEYYVEVSGDCNTVESDMAMLTVLPWTQVIDLAVGPNGMSTYLDLIEDDIATVMAPLVDVLQSVEFMRPSMVYTPGSMSFPWDEAKGAKTIMTDSPDYTLEVTGYPTLGTELTVQSGWSLIPVWSQGVVMAADVFDQLGDNLDLAISIDYSGLYWPDQGIFTLEYLVPGSAYLIKVTGGNHTIDFDVPIVDNTPGYAQLPPNMTTWKDVTMTGVQHVIGITSNALANLQVGDVIGAFNQNGNIAGMVEVTSLKDNIALRVYGNNTTTQKVDGFMEGDLLTFKVYRDGQEIDMIAGFDQSMPNTNVFAENGVSVITDLKAGATSISDPAADLNANLFPNPTSDVVNVTTNFRISNLKVVNYVGQVVYDRNIDQSEIQINTSGFGPGMYFVQIQTTDGIVITKRLTVK